MKILAKRLVLPLLRITSLAIVATLASRYASLDWFVQNDRWLRDGIQAHPIRSALIAFVVYLLTSLFPGLAGKSIMVGWLFGLVVGVMIVNTALVAAAVVAFLLCRHYLKAAVEARFGFYLRPVREHIQRDGAMYLLTLRLALSGTVFLPWVTRRIVRWK